MDKMHEESISTRDMTTGLQVISDYLQNRPDFSGIFGPGEEQETLSDILGVIRDTQGFINRQHIMIEELQKKITLIDKQYTYFLNLFPDPIIITDTNGILFANYAFFILIKEDKTEEIIGKKIIDFVDPDRASLFWEKILQSAEYNSANLFPIQSKDITDSFQKNLVINYQMSDHFQENMVYKNNSEYFIDFTSVFIQKMNQTAILIIMHDYSEQRRREKELEKEGILQIEKNMEQFQILNDQIRNPLTIIAFISSMLNDKKAEEKIAEQVLIINDLVTRLDKGWIESEKVRSFLLRHYRHGEQL